MRDQVSRVGLGDTLRNRGNERAAVRTVLLIAIHRRYADPFHVRTIPNGSAVGKTEPTRRAPGHCRLIYPAGVICLTPRD
ncbi:MAG: hypothetical protein ACP5EN_02490 [Rhodovulum sp.]